MRTAHVAFLSGLSEHPSSGKECRVISVDAAWEMVGQECATTDLWIDPKAPAPPVGTLVQWSGHQVCYLGACWRKLEFDSPSNAPLH